MSVQMAGVGFEPTLLRLWAWRVTNYSTLRDYISDNEAAYSSFLKKKQKKRRAAFCESQAICDLCNTWLKYGTGVKGFEPLHAGIKNRCLSTWLYSIVRMACQADSIRGSSVVCPSEEKRGSDVIRNVRISDLKVRRIRAKKTERNLNKEGEERQERRAWVLFLLSVLKHLEQTFLFLIDPHAASTKRGTRRLRPAFNKSRAAVLLRIKE